MGAIGLNLPVKWNVALLEMVVSLKVGCRGGGRERAKWAIL